MEAEQRQRLGLTLVLGALVVLQWLPLQGLHRLLGGGAVARGPLSALQSEPRSDQPDCRAEDCVVRTQPPAISRRQPLQKVRYVTVPARPLLPDAGAVFVQADEGPQAWLAEHEYLPGKARLGFAQRPIDGGQSLPDRAGTDVAERGYVRGARVSGTALSLGLDGRLRGPDGSVQPAMPEPGLRFSELLFQPLPRRVFIEWPGPAARLPDLGTRVRLHASLGDDEPNDLDGPLPADAVEARVIEQQAYLNPPRLMLEFEPTAIAAWMSHRVQRERVGDGPAFPETMGLQWNTDGASQTPVVSVGMRNLVADSQGLRAWAVIDDRAIPIALRELRRRGDQVVVVEQPGVLGLPVRQADWERLDTAARAVLLNWATHGSGERHDLLRPELALIQSPPAGLQPGQRVRRQS